VTATPQGKHALPFVEVSALLQKYFDGLYDGDTDKLGRVFHPQAHYYTASEGPLLHLDMAQYLPIVKTRPSPASTRQPRTDRILSIDFAGPSTALAKVQCAIGSKHFVDLLSMLRIDGEWKIVAKVFHYELVEEGGGGGRQN
jgi:hypothetical protein